MKKLVYVCAFCFIAFGITTCDKDYGYSNIDDNTNSAMSFQKNSEPDREAKCDDCSEETAWAASAPGVGRYTSRGNWATYITYSGGFKRYNVYAGQYLYAGYIEISEVNEDVVHFYLILFDVEGKEPWCFQDVEEPVKIDGYEDAPSGNPKVGLFPYKPVPVVYTGSIASDGVKYDLGEWEYHPYYGIHLDLGCCN